MFPYSLYMCFNKSELCSFRSYLWLGMEISLVKANLKIRLQHTHVRTFLFVPLLVTGGH